MFWHILNFELRYRFRLVSTWIYIVLFFGIAFLAAISMGGAFDGVEVQAGKVGENSFVNSPIGIASGVSVLIYLCTIVFAAIFGSSAVREFETCSYELHYTKPIKPFTYFAGRFAGAYLSAFFVVLSIIVGYAVGFQMPFLFEYKIGPHYPMAYIHALLFIAAPNLFFLGAALFSIGILSRKVINSYIMGIGFFFAYILAGTLIRDVDTVYKAALLDPFGSITLRAISRYWSTTESNTTFLSLIGHLGWNRLIWVSLGIVAIVFTALRFDFCAHHPAAKKTKKAKPASKPVIDPLFMANVQSTPYRSFKQFGHLCLYEFKNLVFNRTFLIIISFFALFLGIIAANGIGKMYGTQTYPLTNIVVNTLSATFFLFGLLISTFYAGDLLWRDRAFKTDQIYDATPHHSTVRFFSKLGAILIMQLVLLFTIMIVGIVTQIALGFYRIELGLYLFELFVLNFIGLLPYTLVLFFFANLMNNKYAGYIAMILFYAATIMMEVFKINHPLLTFEPGGAYYSEMNGYGVGISRFFLINSYWLLFAITLSFVGFKFWNRGVDLSYKSNIKRIKASGYDTGWKLATISFALFVLLGGFLYYNMNILNDYASPKRIRALQIAYEKTYKERLSALPQPRITEVNYTIDIFPSTRQMNVAGYYWLVNKTAAPIDTLVMNFDHEYTKQTLVFDHPVKVAESNKDYNLTIYQLPQPLAPMDSIRLDFAFTHKPKGIKASDSGPEVMHNGTFFHNYDVFPLFGYNDNLELSNNNDRKKKGLPIRHRMAAITDSTQYHNPYVNTNSDYVRYNALVSTEEGQIAFAPGDLVESYSKGGRYVARYTSSVPLLNFFAFISGKYEKATATFEDKQIEIYYDKKHPYNIDSMLDSAQQSLKYFSANFMPYPHKALRIVEIPYMDGAQSFPSLIAFSENMGFIAKLDTKDKSAVDYPYQVTSHEIGHQWWAHTVIGANVQGATFFSECFTEYSSLMVLRQKYGNEHLRRKLKHDHDNYLGGRSNESVAEQALYMNENQPYLNYFKGTLTMWALQDYIGEANVNKALGDFCKDYAYHSDPYPLSTDTLPYLKNAAPDSLKYLITDLFETITLYDNKILKVVQKYDTKTKEYITTVTFQCEKARYDGLGKKQPIEVADYIDIALYNDKEDQMLSKSTIKVNTGNNSAVIISKAKPGKVILDPYYKMIDTDRKNNSVTTG